jgi:cathepsin D
MGGDRVQLANLTVRAEFGLATEVSDHFSEFPIDGILGLGSTQISQQNVPTVLEEMVRSGLIKRRLFAVALSRASDGLNDGVLNFGGVDPTLYKGNLTFTDSLIGRGVWELPLGGVGVDEKIQEFPDRTAVIDTGSSLVIHPLMS